MPENFPVPFLPILRSEEIISTRSKFRRASALRGSELSREVTAAMSEKFPSGERTTASRDSTA